jgi:hypothetical protein
LDVSAHKISNETELKLPGIVGIIPSGTAPKDTDRDGIPDYWEIAMNLDPNDPADGNKFTIDPSYTNLEVYLNQLAGDYGEPLTPPPALTEVFRGNGQMFDSLMVFDVTNAENWNIRNGLKQGDVVFGDRNFSLAEIPQDLQGSEWIQTSMNSRTNISLDHYASFRAKTNGVLYVAHADRVSVKPAWLNSYTRTNHSIVVQENVSTQRTLTLYEKPFATGDKIFTENNSADGTASSLMYLMIFSDRSIGEPQDEPTVSEIHLQPTPLSLQIKKQSNTTLHIAYSLPMNTKAKLSIYQENGTQIHQQSLLGNAGNHNVKINTPALTPGIYYVHLNTASKTLQKKIVILHP